MPALPKAVSIFLGIVYIVTETDVIVHVKTSDGENINTTMFHPFYVRHSDQESGGSVYDGEWKAASNLLEGDVLQKIDGSTEYVTEVTVEKLAEIINVYNLEIEDLHTYYVADEVLVHNMCKTNNKQENDSGNYPQTRKEIHDDLVSKGYHTTGTTSNGYVVYKDGNGHMVTIKPNGEVIPTTRIAVDPNNTSPKAPKYNQRTYYDGTPIPDELNNHTTGHNVGAISIDDFYPEPCKWDGEPPWKG